MAHRFLVALAILTQLTAPVWALGDDVHPHPVVPRQDILTVATFPNNTWVENLAVRANGQILATLVTSPDLYLVDPEHPHRPPVLVHSFTSRTSLLGITEYQPDVFAVVALNFSLSTFVATPKTPSVWKVNMTGFAASSSGAITHPASIAKIASLPDANLLNGITTLDESNTLVADSFLGVVWRVNTQTGAVAVALNNSALAPPPGSPAHSVGVNGIRSLGKTIYFTNSAAQGLYKVRITANGAAAGKFELVTNTKSFVDDFALFPNGTAFPAGSNRIIETFPGSFYVYAGGKTRLDLEGSTSSQFGRTARDIETLYVTTNGGLGGKVRGVQTGGKILAVL